MVRDIAIFSLIDRENNTRYAVAPKKLNTIFSFVVTPLLQQPLLNIFAIYLARVFSRLSRDWWRDYWTARQNSNDLAMTKYAPVLRFVPKKTTWP